MEHPFNSETIRLAVVGDIEPKPDPIFGNLDKIVRTLNAIHARSPLAFVAGIGDIPHKGTLPQYEAATACMDRLNLPLFTIMGNEELQGGVERFLPYAARWRKNPGGSAELNFVKVLGNYALIWATAAGNGVEFTQRELDWIAEQASQHAGRHKLLFTHAPTKDVFKIDQARAIPNPAFHELLHEWGIGMHFSGHVHIAVDFAPTIVRDKDDTWHVHIPGVERTKVGDTHTPRFRMLTLRPDGVVEVETYNLAEDRLEPEFGARCPLA